MPFFHSNYIGKHFWCNVTHVMLQKDAKMLESTFGANIARKTKCEKGE